MPIPLLQVDAFADRPFAGNPAAVCLLPEPRPAAWMQAVAAEMNLSETAFPVATGDARFDLRWFTPKAEIELCGHATLGAAHAIWECGLARPDRTLEFDTLSGRLRTTRLADGWIEMDFPINRFAPLAPDAPERADASLVANALGPGLHVQDVARSGRDWLVLVSSAAEVRAAAPDMAALATLGRLVIVTAPAEGMGVDFVSRCFVPALGIPEDPVTGAAHCGLAPFWAGRLGRPELVGFQASTRGGTVRVRVEGERVFIAGRAVTVLRGELLG